MLIALLGEVEQYRMIVTQQSMRLYQAWRLMLLWSLERRND